MIKHKLYVPATEEVFESVLRDVVQETHDQIENCLFFVSPRNMHDDRHTLYIDAYLRHPDDLVDVRPFVRRMFEAAAASYGDHDSFDWQPEPRSEVVTHAIQCHIVQLGAERVRVTVTCNDEDAHVSNYCALLVRRLRQDWPEMQITEDEQVVSRGQAHAKGKVSEEMKARANRARSLHAEHPEWSMQDVADHLMDTLTDDELSKLKRGFNRKHSPLMGEDIENAWYRMAEVEGSEKWPKWSTGKNQLR